MKQQFADYETVKRLKELGFDKSCLAFYYDAADGYFSKKFELGSMHKQFNGYFLAPLWQQIEEWLFEEHSMAIQMTSECGTYGNGECGYYYSCYNGNEFIENVSPITAKMEGIKAAVKHLHEKYEKQN